MALTIIPKNLTEVESFRNSVRMLLSLEQAQLSQLRSIAEEAGDLSATQVQAPRVAETLGVDKEMSMWVTSLYSFLLERISEGAGAEAVVADLIELGAELEVQDAPAKADELGRLLDPIPAYEQRARRNRAVTSALPIAVDWSLNLDLRALVDSTGRTEGYVPIPIVRVEFDELVGGQSAVTFQLDQDTLGRLIAELTEMKRRLDEAGMQSDAEGKGAER